MYTVSIVSKIALPVERVLFTRLCIVLFANCVYLCIIYTTLKSREDHCIMPTFEEDTMYFQRQCFDSESHLVIIDSAAEDTYVTDELRKRIDIASKLRVISWVS